MRKWSRLSICPLPNLRARCRRAVRGMRMDGHRVDRAARFGTPAIPGRLTGLLRLRLPEISLAGQRFEQRLSYLMRPPSM